VPEWTQGQVQGINAGNDNSLLMLADRSVVELGKLWFEECCIDKESMGKILDVKTNRIHTLMLMDNGMVKCVGRNMYGECSAPKEYLY